MKINNSKGIQLLCIIFVSGSILAIVCHYVYSNRSQPENSLKFVTVVTRHGARVPLHSYPNDPYGNFSKYWPEGIGGLTKVGKQQMYKVGQILRNRYDGFLGQHYISSEFMAQSTMVERTYMSAATLLAGLYPPKTYQIWNPTIDWQPIPIYSTILDKSFIALYPAVCPRFWKEQNHSLANFIDKNPDYDNLFDMLTKYTGKRIERISDMYDVWDALTSQYWNNMDLPDWTKGIYPDLMAEPLSRLFKTKTVGTQTMSRLLVGPFLYSLISYMSGKINGTLEPDRKMLFHSSHDFMLFGLLNVFGFTNTKIINPSTALITELHYNNKEEKYYVKVLVIKGTWESPEPVEVELPNCVPPCAFDTFVSTIEKHLVSDWDKDCELTG